MERVPNRNSPPAVLLRESRRTQGKKANPRQPLQTPRSRRRNTPPRPQRRNPRLPQRNLPLPPQPPPRARRRRPRNPPTTRPPLPQRPRPQPAPRTCRPSARVIGPLQTRHRTRPDLRNRRLHPGRTPPPRRCRTCRSTTPWICSAASPASSSASHADTSTRTPCPLRLTSTYVEGTHCPLARRGSAATARRTSSRSSSGCSAPPKGVLSPSKSSKATPATRRRWPARWTSSASASASPAWSWWEIGACSPQPASGRISPESRACAGSPPCAPPPSGNSSPNMSPAGPRRSPKRTSPANGSSSAAIRPRRRAPNMSPPPKN